MLRPLFKPTATLATQGYLSLSDHFGANLDVLKWHFSHPTSGRVARGRGGESAAYMLLPVAGRVRKGANLRAQAPPFFVLAQLTESVFASFARVYAAFMSCSASLLSSEEGISANAKKASPFSVGHLQQDLLLTSPRRRSPFTVRHTLEDWLTMRLRKKTNLIASKHYNFWFFDD